MRLKKVVAEYSAARNVNITLTRLVLGELGPEAKWWVQFLLPALSERRGSKARHAIVEAMASVRVPHWRDARRLRLISRSAIYRRINLVETGRVDRLARGERADKGKVRGARGPYRRRAKASAKVIPFPRHNS